MFVHDDTLVCLTENAALAPSAAHIPSLDAGLKLLQGSGTRSCSAGSTTDRTSSSQEVSPRSGCAGSGSARTGVEAREVAITTLMLRNLPRRFFAEDLMDELSRFVRSDSYDFVHVPVDPKDEANIGYAFVNFKDPKDAEAVSKGLAGQIWTTVESSRRAKVAKASVQGFSANLKHCSERIAEDADERHFPVVLHEGKIIGFRAAEQLLQRRADLGHMEAGAAKGAATAVAGPSSHGIEAQQQSRPTVQRQQQSQHRPQSPVQAASAPWSTWAPRPVAPQQRQQQKNPRANLKMQPHQVLPRAPVATKAARVPTNVSNMTVAPPPGLEDVVRMQFPACQTAAGGLDAPGKDLLVAPSAAATGVASTLLSSHQSEQFSGSRTSFVGSSAYDTGSFASKMDGLHGRAVGASPVLGPEQSGVNCVMGTSSWSAPTPSSCGFVGTSTQATDQWEAESSPSSFEDASVSSLMQSVAFQSSARQIESQLLQLLSMQPRMSSF